MSLLYECVNTVIAGELWRIVNFSQISFYTVFHWQIKLINSLSNFAVLISLSSGMPNHSASIQVSLVLLFLFVLMFNVGCWGYSVSTPAELYSIRTVKMGRAIEIYDCLFPACSSWLWYIISVKIWHSLLTYLYVIALFEPCKPDIVLQRCVKTRGCVFVFFMALLIVCSHSHIVGLLLHSSVCRNCESW